MSDLQAGTRVFLTASGDRHHPPVGTAGTVTDVTGRGSFVDHSELVTVRWDNGAVSVVSYWNGKIARVWS